MWCSARSIGRELGEFSQPIGQVVAWLGFLGHGVPMMKCWTALVLALAFVPLASHAAVNCGAFEKRIIELDHDIVCAERKGGSARLDYMLERNFLTEMYNIASCPERKFVERVMNARANVKCERR